MVGGLGHVLTLSILCDGFWCEQIDAYNEDILAEERDRLRETNPFTILEYIKTSIEILMNMKIEEQ